MRRRALIAHRIARTSELVGCKNNGTSSAEMPVHWQASSRQVVAIRAGVFTAEILAERSNNEVQVQFPANLLPQFCMLANRDYQCTRALLPRRWQTTGRCSSRGWRGLGSSASCTSLDAQGQCALRIKVGDVGEAAARQSRLDVFARQDKARQWDGLTQRRRIEVVGVARCIGERSLLAHMGKGRACFQSVCVGAGFCVRCLHALSRNLSRREMASVTVVGDVAG